MKFSIRILMCLLLAGSITFLSCDKESQMVEEDLNGFDVQPPDWFAAEDISPTQEQVGDALKVQTNEDVLNQQIPGHKITQKQDGMFVVYPETMSEAQALGKARSANPKMIFDNTPGTQGIMVKNGSGGYCSMGTYTEGVTFVLNANPLACAGTLSGCSDERMDWRQVVYVSGCNTSKLRYINSSGSVSDTDYMSREGYNWLYMRCSFEGNSPGHADIKQGSCGSSYSGKFCDESY